MLIAGLGLLETGQHQLLFWISSQANPIPFGYIESHSKFQDPSWFESAASRYKFLAWLLIHNKNWCIMDPLTGQVVEDHLLHSFFLLGVTHLWVYKYKLLCSLAMAKKMTCFSYTTKWEMQFHWCLHCVGSEWRKKKKKMAGKLKQWVSYNPVKSEWISSIHTSLLQATIKVEWNR